MNKVCFLNFPIHYSSAITPFQVPAPLRRFFDLEAGVDDNDYDEEEEAPEQDLQSLFLFSSFM